MVAMDTFLRKMPLVCVARSSLMPLSAARSTVALASGACVSVACVICTRTKSAERSWGGRQRGRSGRRALPAARRGRCCRSCAIESISRLRLTEHQQDLDVMVPMRAWGAEVSDGFDAGCEKLSEARGCDAVSTTGSASAGATGSGTGSGGGGVDASITGAGSATGMDSTTGCVAGSGCDSACWAGCAPVSWTWLADGWRSTAGLCALREARCAAFRSCASWSLERGMMSAFSGRSHLVTCVAALK